MHLRTLLSPLALLGFGAALIACGEDAPEDAGSGGPEPALTTIRRGTLMADGPGGAPDALGTISLGRDASGALFVALGSDFRQEMGPGDTQLILASSAANVNEQRAAAPGSVSGSLGTIPNGFAGARTFPVPAGVDAETFTHAIVWCPTAGVNFGAAALQAVDAAATEVRRASLVADGPGGAPDATGTVRVLRSASGLEIELGADFRQEMGPGATQLILARAATSVADQRAADPSSASASLGTIPNGASGRRTFAVPAGVDLDAFDHVIVWCPTAGVNFGAAELPRRTGALVADGAGGAPDATGTVRVARDAANRLVVELGDDFRQEMGPGDTQLILARSDANVSAQRAASPDAASPSLGTIPNGATGARGFVVPDGVDVDDFDHAIVWCPTAGVNFGAARLR